MSISLFKRLSCLGLSPHAWKTFLYLNFIAPKLGGGNKGLRNSGTHHELVPRHSADRTGRLTLCET